MAIVDQISFASSSSDGTGWAEAGGGVCPAAGMSGTAASSSATASRAAAIRHGPVPCPAIPEGAAKLLPGNLEATASTDDAGVEAYADACGE